MKSVRIFFSNGLKRSKRRSVFTQNISINKQLKYIIIYGHLLISYVLAFEDNATKADIYTNPKSNVRSNFEDNIIDTSDDAVYEIKLNPKYEDSSVWLRNDKQIFKYVVENGDTEVNIPTTRNPTEEAIVNTIYKVNTGQDDLKDKSNKDNSTSVNITMINQKVIHTQLHNSTDVVSENSTETHIKTIPSDENTNKSLSNAEKDWLLLGNNMSYYEITKSNNSFIDTKSKNVSLVKVGGISAVTDGNVDNTSLSTLINSNSNNTSVIYPIKDLEPKHSVMNTNLGLENSTSNSSNIMKISVSSKISDRFRPCNVNSPDCPSVKKTDNIIVKEPGHSTTNQDKAKKSRAIIINNTKLKNAHSSEISLKELKPEDSLNNSINNDTISIEKIENSTLNQNKTDNSTLTINNNKHSENENLSKINLKESKLENSSNKSLKNDHYVLKMSENSTINLNETEMAKAIPLIDKKLENAHSSQINLRVLKPEKNLNQSRNNDTDEGESTGITDFYEVDFESDEVQLEDYDTRILIESTTKKAPTIDPLSAVLGFAGSVAETVVERVVPKWIMDVMKRMQKQNTQLETIRLRSKEENGGIGQFGRNFLKGLSTGIYRPLNDWIQGVRDFGSLDSDKNFFSGVASGVVGVADGVVNMASGVLESFKDRVQAIYPGTLWCGDGHMAREQELGLFFFTDTCCRQHDVCKLYIASGETRFGLTNTGLFTRSHCSCDDSFRRCLKRTGSLVSSQIGLTFFNVLGPQCFKKTHPIVRCVRRTRITGQKCEEYELDYTKPKMWQWFDNETF